MSRISNRTARLSTVETVAIEWEEHHRSVEGPPVERGSFSHSMHATAKGFEPILPCSNPDCQGGGFEILETVESMVRNRRQEKTGLLVCIGWERTKRGQIEPLPCTQVIDYRIRLTYRKKHDSPRNATGRHRDE